MEKNYNQKIFKIKDSIFISNRECIKESKVLNTDNQLNLKIINTREIALYEFLKNNHPVLVMFTKAYQKVLRRKLEEQSIILII